MKQNRHRAIHGSGLSMESPLIRKLLNGEGPEPFQDLYGKKGALFSTATLNRFIREEYIHDDYALSRDEHRSIRTFSSGEQKKALLAYLLSDTPEFLVLDNAFDMLDTASQNQLASRLTELAESVTIIQIFRRQDTLLPFIDHVLSFQGDGVVFSGTVDNYRSQFSDIRPVTVNGRIPPALGDSTPVGEPLVQFNHVSVNYGKNHILSDICWEIRKGDFWQLTGPNGSGKTTLLTMITGDNPKAYGQDLTLFGRKKGSGESVWDIKQNIGYVTPAMTVLFNGRHTVEHMVVSGLYDSIGQYRTPTPLQLDLAGQWIDVIGLTDVKHRWFSELSEDRQCMVLIARSMIKHPPLLILDEPSHGLDDTHVALLTALVNKIAQESNTAIIYVSHRNEQGLAPEMRYELIPGVNGSKGSVLRQGSPSG